MDRLLNNLLVRDFEKDPTKALTHGMGLDHRATFAFVLGFYVCLAPEGLAGWYQLSGKFVYPKPTYARTCAHVSTYYISVQIIHVIIYCELDSYSYVHSYTYYLHLVSSLPKP